MSLFTITLRSGLIAGISIFIFALTVHELSFLPDGRLHMYVLDIGQGDSLLLITPSGKQIIIDGGDGLTTLEQIPKFMSFFDRSIDLLVLTHPHADHLGAFTEILRRYRISKILLTGASHTLGRYESMLDEITSQEISVIIANAVNDIDMGDGVLLDVIWPNELMYGKVVDELNDTSIVLRVLYRDESILLTGDIEESVENKILSLGVYLQSDILKIAHHGSRTSSSTGFLLEVDPNLAVISVGQDNKFSHPHSETLSRLETLGIPVKTTASDGVLSLHFGQ